MTQTQKLKSKKWSKYKIWAEPGRIDKNKTKEIQQFLPTVKIVLDPWGYYQIPGAI